MTARMMPLALLVLLSGCVGPSFLKVQRYKYNEAIQESTAEQLLLNIVRLRYNDSPMFLNVGDIDARFSLDATSMASGTINENVGADPLNANSATVTASSKFTNNPNIKLRPMQDADFARLLKPVTFGDMLAHARAPGSVYKYLALAMQSYTQDNETIDAYRNTSKWKKFLAALKESDRRGLLLSKGKVVDKELLPRYAASSIAPEDVIEAKLAGLTFKKTKDKDEYVLVSKVRSWSLRLPVDPLEPGVLIDDPEERGARIEYTWDVREPRDEYTELKEGQVIYRSIVQMMYCLSLGVEVPPPHKPEWDVEERDGLAGNSGILAFEVKFKDLPPRNAFVSVKYRGYWFYIERSSTSSKKFFSVLTELFVERAGKPATTATTLPL